MIKRFAIGLLALVVIILVLSTAMFLIPESIWIAVPIIVLTVMAATVLTIAGDEILIWWRRQ